MKKIYTLRVLKTYEDTLTKKRYKVGDVTTRRDEDRVRFLLDNGAVEVLSIKSKG